MRSPPPKCGILVLLLSLWYPGLGSGSSQEEDPAGACMACHQSETRGIFQAWVNSRHAAEGVTCVTCHESHEAARAVGSAVAPERCAACHREQHQALLRSRHAVAWERMEQHPQYQALPADLRSAFCQSCHAIQHECNSCHASHAFDPEEARHPVACKKCHTGPSGPHDEMYASSQHGTIYAARGDADVTPTCVTCHMPGGSHDVSEGLIYDSWGEPVDREGRAIPPERREEVRARLMEEVCLECHTKSLTRERLELADRVRRETKALLAEAEGIIRDLEEDGILAPGVVLGERQRQAGTSRIESLYYRMFRFHSVYAWKGAYHFSADYAHWYGWAHLQMSLTEIREEARKLRRIQAMETP